jgi:vacuolar-type H+-ATPase subunit E/Vma4
MAETLESFVAKLQAEGVQAGRQAAEKIRSDAQTQAEEIVAGARKEAAALLAQAQAQAQGELERARTDLRLAARDATLRLRDGLTRAVRAVLARGAKAGLTDKDFLCKIIHELVVLYARADLEGRSTLEVNVSPETRKRLTDWALRELADEALRRSGSTVNLTETLKQEGFELRLADSAIEVTLESVVNALAELVSPGLREVLESGLGEEKK